MPHCCHRKPVSHRIHCVIDYHGMPMSRCLTDPWKSLDMTKLDYELPQCIVGDGSLLFERQALVNSGDPLALAEENRLMLMDQVNLHHVAFDIGAGARGQSRFDCQLGLEVAKPSLCA